MGGRGVGGRGMTYRPPLSVVLKRSWPVTLIGVLLILVSLAVMFDNERSAVTVTHALEDGYNNILVIPDTTAVVFEENNGKLVLVAGELVVQDNLEDPTYGVAIPAVKLKKTAQMFQWYETEDARQEVIHEGERERISIREKAKLGVFHDRNFSATSVSNRYFYYIQTLFHSHFHLLL